jgi:hypothetical protein
MKEMHYCILRPPEIPRNINAISMEYRSGRCVGIDMNHPITHVIPVKVLTDGFFSLHEKVTTKNFIAPESQNQTASSTKDGGLRF